MKKLILLLSAVFGTVLMSCTAEYYESPLPGPEGPQGPQGVQGPAGESSFVFEYTEVTFSAPDYETILSFPDGFEGLASDVVMAYLLWDVEEVNGESVEIWRQLPQQVFAPFGTIQYNYDFTMYDVRLFMEGTFAPEDLQAVDTDNWIVRLVVVPGNFWSNGRVDTISYEVLVTQLGGDALKEHLTTQERRDID